MQYALWMWGFKNNHQLARQNTHPIAFSHPLSVHQADCDSHKNHTFLMVGLHCCFESFLRNATVSGILGSCQIQLNSTYGVPPKAIVFKIPGSYLCNCIWDMGVLHNATAFNIGESNLKWLQTSIIIITLAVFCLLLKWLPIVSMLQKSVRMELFSFFLNKTLDVSTYFCFWTKSIWKTLFTMPLSVAIPLPHSQTFLRKYCYLIMVFDYLQSQFIDVDEQLDAYIFRSLTQTYV